MKIGVAGLMGAGKSTFASIIAGSDGKIINADKVAKQLTNQNTQIKKCLAMEFGSDVLLNNNKINFQVLAERAFQSTDSLAKLNSIVHPILLRRLKTLCSISRRSFLVVDAALIPMWKIENWFDRLYWVEASMECRLQRLLKKLSVDERNVLHRMRIQQKLLSRPKSKQWRIIINQGTIEELNLIGRQCRDELLSEGSTDDHCIILKRYKFKTM